MSSDWKKIFIIIWSGQFFSILTSTLVNFAIIIWLSIHTGSAQVLAFAAIAAILPQAVVGPFTGVFIDRWNRKMIMIFADLFVAFCTVIIAALFFFEIRGTGYIYFLLVLRSLGSALHQPAMQASVPLLAPKSELTRIAGVNEAILSVGNIAGPALAAVMLGIMDISYVMLVDAVGAAAAVTTLLFVKIPNPERSEHIENNFGREFKEAFTAIHAVKGMTLLFLFMVIVMFFLMPVGVMFPLMTLQHFSGTTYQMSIIEAVWGIGMLAGGGLMGIMKYRKNDVKLLNVTYLIIGLTFALSGMLPHSGYIWFVVFTIIAGIAGSANHAMFAAVIQKKIDPVYLGRVFSVNFSITLFPAMLGLLGTGFVADSIGITAAFIISGTVISLAGIASFFFPSLTKLGESKEPAETEEVLAEA